MLYLINYEDLKMPLQKHSLVLEFPEYRELIHQMKMDDERFAHLFTAYDTIEHAVHRIEAGAEAASDEHLEDLKKQRAKLKDDLFLMLKKQAA